VSDSQGTLVGNLTRDPELRYSAGGAPVLSLGLAVNRRKKVGDDWEEETSFFNAVCFGSLAENLAATVSKGNRVLLVGSWVQRNYEKDGETKSTTEFVVEHAGPELRWAQAKVTRNEKGASSGRSSGGQKSSGRRQAVDPVYGDEEEPF
jgi:single-strand DNA-binding protein